MNDTDFQNQMTFDDFQNPKQISIDDLITFYTDTKV